MKKKFILYDGRACADQGTDDAQVLEVCNSLKEARLSTEDHGDGAIYSYDIAPPEKPGGTERLINETWLEDFGL